MVKPQDLAIHCVSRRLFASVWSFSVTRFAVLCGCLGVATFKGMKAFGIRQVTERVAVFVSTGYSDSADSLLGEEQNAAIQWFSDALV